MKYIAAILIFTFSYSPVAAKTEKSLGIPDVIGKIIYTDGGSQILNFIMSIGIEVKGRNLVEIKFIGGSEILTSPDVSTSPNEVESIMINCKTSKYSVYDKNKVDAISFYEYKSWNKFKWSDHTSQGAIPQYFERDDLKILFEKVCKYTG